MQDIYKGIAIIVFVITVAGMTNSAQRYQNILIDILIKIIISIMLAVFWPIALILFFIEE
jgi:hypothetical protein